MRAATTAVYIQTETPRHSGRIRAVSEPTPKQVATPKQSAIKRYNYENTPKISHVRRLLNMVPTRARARAKGPLFVEFPGFSPRPEPSGDVKECFAYCVSAAVSRSRFRGASQ